MAAQSIEHRAGTAAKIGPNAVIQTVNALLDMHGRAATQRLLEQIGKPWLLDYHPGALIDEHEFAALYHDLIGALGIDATGLVMARAGGRTARYVMANRIPRPIHWLLRLLPRRLSLKLLLGAIGKHAWTFAGSGQFSYSLGRTPLLALANSLTARGLASAGPACAFYQAAFQGFMETLIDPRLRVREVRCAACGAARCEFTIEVAQ
ncbi:MAG: bacteriochlorophyll 4-vinyl reductase [Kouleothrix sp.]